MDRTESVFHNSFKERLVSREEQIEPQIVVIIL